MTFTVRLAPPALEELDEAARWYEERRIGLGAEFVDAVETTARSLARWPEAGSPIAPAGDRRFRRAPVEGFPYYLPYRVVDEVVEVLAVAHDRRRPKYWAARSPDG